jgi:oxygen-independent coproporphyrinogen-3 oxidase
VRHKKPENWLAAVAERGHGIAEERLLGAREQASEALLMGLRLSEGIDLALLSRRFGIPAGELIDSERLAFHGSLGLVRREGSRVVVTDAGMPLLDALLGELVPAGLVEA